LVSVVIDYSVFSLSIAFGNALLSSQFIARFCAGTVNYFLNKQFVFKSDRSHLYSMSLYVATLVGMGLCSYGLILVITEQLGVNVLVAKIISELLLYFASFAIQREIVFGRRDSA
jgi:putative flippase GtrA